MKSKLVALGVCIGIVLGFGIGWASRTPTTKIVEVSAQAATTERIAPISTVPVTTEAPAPDEPQIVLNFAGTANGSSEDFTVGPRWELSWTSDGLLNVEILDPSNKVLELVTVKAGSAKSLQREACTCHLKVSTFGADSYVFVVTTSEKAKSRAHRSGRGSVFAGDSAILSLREGP